MSGISTCTRRSACGHLLNNRRWSSIRVMAGSSFSCFISIWHQNGHPNPSVRLISGNICEERLRNIRPSVAAFSNRRSPNKGGRREQGFGFSREGPDYVIRLNGANISIPEGNLWQLAIPAAALLGLAAMIGPLVIGIAFTAVAIGGALSIGAFAFSFLWLPIISLLGFLTLIFGGFTFGAAATLGFGFLLPKLISLAVTAGSLGLGFLAVKQGFIQIPGVNTPSSDGPPSGASTQSTASSSRDQGPVVDAESKSLDEREQEMRRMSRELREFDTMMAERAEQARIDEWRRSVDKDKR